MLCLIAALRQSAPAQRPATSEVTHTYETVKVADGVYAFIAPETNGAIVNGNSTLIVGDSVAMVVDAGHFPALTRRMIDDIRKLTTRPVRFLVNTHWHPDHWVGNAEFSSSFPNLTILSTEYTRRQIEQQGPAFLKSYRDSSGLVEPYNALLRSGKWLDGSPLSADESRLIIGTIAAAVAAVPGWRTARVQLPTLTFELGTVRVQLGGREVCVIFAGRGNTAGDAIVHVPGAGVVITGDLVVAPTPYAYGSFIGEWVSTLEKLRGLGASVLVPGHGPIQRNADYLDLLADLLASVRTQVAEAVRRGLTLDETRKAVNLDRFESRFAGDNLDRRRAFQIGFVAPAVQRAYEETKFNSER